MSEEHRGRDPLISTGRGGAGNHVRSISRGPEEAAGAERGRELREPSVERVSSLCVAVSRSGAVIVAQIEGF